MPHYVPVAPSCSVFCIAALQNASACIFAYKHTCLRVISRSPLRIPKHYHRCSRRIWRYRRFIIAQVQLGLLGNQTAAARGGLGLGAALSTSVIVGNVNKPSAVAGDAVRGQATAAPTRANGTMGSAGWARASQFAQKQTALALQVPRDGSFLI